MKVVKLILIEPGANNNKFYNMTEQSDGTFLAEWGRVGNSGQSMNKPMGQWDKVYREKTGKGYKDKTELYVVESNGVSAVTTTIKKDFLSSRKDAVISMVKKLQAWAKGSIKENYTVSSENVTQKQVDAAQELLNKLAVYDLKDDPADWKIFNAMLVEFYSIVPRKMGKVADHIINSSTDLIERKNKIVSAEQDTLDVMAGQVRLNTNTTTPVADTTAATVETDIIKASGLEFDEVTDAVVIAKIKKLMGSNAQQFKMAYEVRNNATHTKYDSHYTKAPNKKEELFWHGSRNENWWSILTSGLLIRPSNAVHTGSMYSDGIYFASLFQKSYGYTSARNSYWVKGNSDEAVLALYKVHVGNQKVFTQHTSDCYNITYNKLNKDGYDSVHAKAGVSIRNDEFIIYQAQQCTVQYLVVVNA